MTSETSGVAASVGVPPAGPAGGTLWQRAVHAARLVWRAGPWLTVGCGGLAVVSGVAPVGIAWLTKLILDELSGEDRTTTALLALAGGLAVAGVLTASVPHVSRYLEGRLHRQMDLYTRGELFAAVNQFTGLARFENPLFHDHLRLAQQAGQAAAAQIVLPVISTIRTVVTVTGFVIALTLLNPIMTLLVLVAAVPAVIAELMLSRQRARMVWRISPSSRRQVFYASLLTDASAAKEVRLFGLGDFLRGRLLHELRTSNGHEQALERRELVTQTGLSALSAVAAGVGLVWVIASAAGGALSIGDVAMFVAAVAGVQSGIAGVVGEIGGVYGALLLFSHYRSVTQAGSDLPTPANPRPVPQLRTGIELRDVWFRYDETHPWVLRGVNLFLPHGRSVALVGLNGSGKSTLVKLLCRFYDPQRGAVLWDGVDLREIDPDTLRARMAAVFQDCVEYDFTAADNVGVGDLAALSDLARIRAAATSAGIDRTLADLPRGYDTMLSRAFFALGDDPDQAAGVLLSGGQWQRVALARAYLRRDRDLVILDEPSAGLDAEAEHQLHNDLRRQRAGRTSILISHRLSAVRDADLIVVLEDGRIVEQGTHAELVAAEGGYARLFAIQAEGYQSDPHPGMPVA